MTGVLDHDSALLRLCWARNLVEKDEFSYESCPWSKIDRLTCLPAFQHASTVLVNTNSLERSRKNQKSSVGYQLPLYHGCLHFKFIFVNATQTHSPKSYIYQLILWAHGSQYTKKLQNVSSPMVFCITPQSSQ